MEIYYNSFIIYKYTIFALLNKIQGNERNF